MMAQGGHPGFIGLSALALAMSVACVDCCRAEDASPPAKTAKQNGTNGAAKRTPDETRVELERLEKGAQQKKGKSKGGNAFGATSWYVPPPPPKPLPPPPPPPPTAPPMPFSYLGLYEGSSGKVIMLVRGDHVYTVGVGDVIDNTYRIDGFDHG